MQLRFDLPHALRRLARAPGFQEAKLGNWSLSFDC